MGVTALIVLVESFQLFLDRHFAQIAQLVIILCLAEILVIYVIQEPLRIMVNRIALIVAQIFIHSVEIHASLVEMVISPYQDHRFVVIVKKERLRYLGFLVLTVLLAHILNINFLVVEIACLENTRILENQFALTVVQITFRMKLAIVNHAAMGNFRFQDLLFVIFAREVKALLEEIHVSIVQLDCMLNTNLLHVETVILEDFQR
jgi:hypothetical protein